MTFSDQQILQFKSLIEAAGTVVLIPHRNPDGDAIGSTLGWCNVLRNKGLTANVLVPDDVPPNLMWMKGSSDIVVFSRQKKRALELLKRSELLILADFNQLDRCGDIAAPVKKLKVPRVVIDHHPYPDPNLGEVIFSDTSVSSTSELSCHIINALGWEKMMDVDAAACFYTGIITDTGSLSYNSSHADTYRVVATLVEMGIDKDRIHQELFQSNSLSRTQLLGHVLCNKLELLNGYGAAFISLSKDELDTHNYVPGDTEGFVNYPLSIEGINISALFTEKEKEKYIRISFRSRGEVPVNHFAEKYFSGGGHPNAAGGEWHGTLNEAVERFREMLPRYLKHEKASKEQESKP